MSEIGGKGGHVADDPIENLGEIEMEKGKGGAAAVAADDSIRKTRYDEDYYAYDHPHYTCKSDDELLDKQSPHQVMNGKKGSVEINIPSVTKAKLTEPEKKSQVSFSWKSWISNVWEYCKEDPNRVFFSLKAGLAVLLVSLLILLRAPYEVFGTNNIIWSILTVAIMFEFTVGATFNKGFNRALGSVLAGVLAICVAQFALSSGSVAEPIIIGISVFLVGTITSFMKLWPSFKQYEYGFRVVLFTYCLIIASEYRMGNPITTVLDRLYSIAIGGVVAVLVNVLVFPIWAGEQLHKELVSSFNSVADSLEECVKKYLQEDGLTHPEFPNMVIDEFPDEPAYKKCRSTLNSSAKLESLANSAKWEPPHGRFNHFFYPWSEYVKVDAVLRYCGYEVMALHGVLHSEIQAPYNLRIAFQREIEEATRQASELIRCLGKDISNMQHSLKTSLLTKVHVSAERLQRALDMHSYLLTTPNYETDDSKSANETNALVAEIESYHEAMRKQQRKLYSWPYEEEFIPKMRALETTAALSLATFTSLLIEFVARLDHLVEAVDQLSKKAKFKNPEVAL